MATLPGLNKFQSLSQNGQFEFLVGMCWMSRRELRALHCESATSETLGLRSGKRRAMLQDTDASTEVTRELRGEVNELKRNLTVRENELRAL